MATVVTMLRLLDAFTPQNCHSILNSFSFGDQISLGQTYNNNKNSKKKVEVVMLFGVVGLGTQTVCIGLLCRHHSKRDAAKHHDRLTFCIPLASQWHQSPDSTDLGQRASPPAESIRCHARDFPARTIRSRLRILTDAFHCGLAGMGRIWCKCGSTNKGHI
jgi:hypothetical protein